MTLGVGGYGGKLSHHSPSPSAGLKTAGARGQLVAPAQSPSKGQLQFRAGSVEKLSPQQGQLCLAPQRRLPPVEPAGLPGLIACGGRAPVAPLLPDS